MSPGANQLCAATTQIERPGKPILSVRDEDRAAEATCRRVACVVDGSLDFGAVVIARVHPLWRCSIVQHHVQYLVSVPAWERGVIPRVKQWQRPSRPPSRRGHALDR